MDIFEVARAGDLEAVRGYLNREIDLREENAYGFTVLHCAAMACNTADEQTATALIRMLIDAEANVNAIARDGRTVLYLAAEFSRWIEPLRLLIAAGANPNIRDSHGNHIVVNAATPEVKKFLSDLTGVPAPPPRTELP